jgi:hypothetical protein
MTKVRVWLSHDGYRDPDDNLAQLVGAAQARIEAKSTPDLSIAGVVYGDTTDGGQFHMLHPSAPTPPGLGNDPRFDDVAKNKIAAGNYAFFKAYAAPAIKQMAPGWDVFDTLAGDSNGYREWNYGASNLANLRQATRELIDDILGAMRKGGGANPNEVVVYSAGGGAHVPAEAISYLRGRGHSEASIKEHFAIVQHGRTNFALNLEPQARDITRAYTIAISKQDMDQYQNGMSGPGLGRLVRDGVHLEGDRFGGKMALALDVAQGQRPFENLGPNKTFKATTDGSDSGSHAFAADIGTLLANWGARLRPGDFLPSAAGREHQIQQADGSYRLRVIYDEFDWRDARQLMNGGTAAARLADAEPEAGVRSAALAAPEPDAAPDASPDAAGPAVALGGLDVFAFRLDGSAGAVGAAEGKLGVVGAGDDAEIQRVGDASEKLLVDLGGDAEAIALVLAGLAVRGDAREAARVTAYAEDGSLVDSLLVTENGPTTLGFDAPARYAVLEAADWITDGPAPAGDPDFSLRWIEVV